MIISNTNKKVLLAFCIIAVLLTILDIIFTLYGLSKGAVELNPIMQFLIVREWGIGIKLLVSICLSTYLYLRNDLILTYIVNSILFLIVINNLVVISIV